MTTIGELKASELKELEDIVGKPFGAVFGGAASGDLSSLDVETMVAFVWLLERRDEPALTLETVWDYSLDELGARMQTANVPKEPAAATP